MKKIFIVMLLVIASGLWNSTNGACMVPAKSNSDLPTISVSGELYERAYPCEPGEMCPTCLTPALETDNGIYYLTTTDAEIEAQLDSLFNYLYSLNCICTFPTRVTGTTYQNGSFKYINISHIETGDPYSYDAKLSHYFPKGTKWINRKTERDPMTGKITSNSEGTYILSEDTLIGGKTYHKLIDEKGQLFATLREDGKKIYFRYNDIDMLLYDFGVKVGDSIVFDYSAFSASRYQTPYIVYVDRIDTITLLDGRQAKAIDYYSNGERLGPDIEYVGNDRGLIAPIVDPEVPTLLGLRHASCCSFKGEPIYEYNQGDCEELNAAAQESKISSLCDEWHVLREPFSSFSPYSTIHFALTTDTTINARHYIKLESTEGKNTLYEGALREENKKVYFVPVGSNNEYLLYAFDAQKGEQLSNVWGGGRAEIYKNSFDAVVTDISDDTPRIFTLTLNTSEEEHYQIQWLEGIGFMDGPIGSKNIYDFAADYGVFRLLCAYKDGVQVYISKYGEEFGCEFNGVHTEDADTIPLYTGDDPGSSTIDPIDPNQVVVTLNGNELNIKESSGDEINYTLVLNKNKQAPAKEQTVQANSFIHSVSIELFESGYYTLLLTNPKWTNSLVGHFQYINTAIEEVQGDERCNAKILRDGQLLIRVGERLYTPTGMQIQ